MDELTQIAHEMAGDPDEGLTPTLQHWIAQENQRQQKEKTERFDWSAHREDDNESWREFADGHTVPQWVGSLLNQSVLLPRHDFQSKIVLSYLMLPAALCKLLPILYSHGPSGTGKSYLGKLAYLIHNTSPIGANSTATSIRNYINSTRKFNPSLLCSSRGNERLSYAMIWEDISPEEMARNEGMVFNLLKLGIDRRGQITRANMEGGLDVFEVFSPKYISSISAIYSQPEFNELIRRLIVIEHKSLKYWKASDYSSITQGVDLSSLIALDEIDFTGFKEEFEQYWMDDDTIARWKSNSAKIRAKRNHGIQNALWQMSKDLICCGLTCDVWESLDEAASHMRTYWEWHEDNVSSQSTSNLKMIKEFVEEQTAPIRESNQEAIDRGLGAFCMPLEINPKALKDHIDGCRANGLLDGRLDDKERSQIMERLGWIIGPGKGGKQVWKPRNS
jgi:hypothetical protein